jgi:2-iminobutanoate/2-iminopropanoate deaminase
VRLVVYVTDIVQLRPLLKRVQEKLCAGQPYPPRTIAEVSRLYQDDIIELDGDVLLPR